MKLRALCAVLIGASLLGGCSGDSGGSDGIVRTGATEPKTTPDGRLETNPTPLTLNDVSRLEAGSAKQALMELLFWAQWGNLPSVIDAYDLRVSGELGAPSMTAAYADLRPQLIASKIRVLHRKQRGDTAFFGVEFLSKQEPPQRESFLLRRRAGKWRILNDTLLERGLKNSAQSRIAAGSATPSPRAVRAGDRAAERYRSIYPSIQLSRRLKSGRGQSAPAPNG
jgi:hypothetical protein